MLPGRVVVLLNGTSPSRDLLRTQSSLAPVYAADGGAVICMEADVRPVLVTGDFDSVPPDRLPPDWPVRVVEDQDRTDFQKVLASLPPDTREVVILGGMGGRIDHQWTNLILASGLPSSWRVSFVSDTVTLLRATPDCPQALSLPSGTCVSLLPLGTAAGVSTAGLRWNLADATLGCGSEISQSNRTEGASQTVSVGKGVVFVWAETAMA